MEVLGLVLYIKKRKREKNLVQHCTVLSVSFVFAAVFVRLITFNQCRHGSKLRVFEKLSWTHSGCEWQEMKRRMAGKGVLIWAVKEHVSTPCGGLLTTDVSMLMELLGL